jgi:hypothetical protein
VTFNRGLEKEEDWKQLWHWAGVGTSVDCFQEARSLQRAAGEDAGCQRDKDRLDPDKPLRRQGEGLCFMICRRKNSWDSGYSSVAEHLSSMHKAPGSIPKP